MAFKFIDDKIKVFISSKCGEDNEDYEIIRNGLKNLFEETGFINTYIFEYTNSSSKNIQDEYLNKLEDSDIVLFLIDNKEYNCSEGVMKEWEHSKSLDKKAIYLFYNYKDKEITSIQKELKKPNSLKYTEVSTKKEFLEKGYKSILEDVIKIYRDYCKNRLYTKVNSEIRNELDQLSKEDNLLNHIQSWELEKNIINKFPNIKLYFESRNKINSLQDIKTNCEVEGSFLYFIRLLLCEEDYNKEYIQNLINHILVFHDDTNNDVNKSIIVRKWNSISYLYRDNLSKAIESLDEAYNIAKENNVDKWIINDILIDKRNLEHKCNMNGHIYSGHTDAQKVLNSNKDLLYYPLLDRISHKIYEGIIKEFNRIQRGSGPYSTNIGTCIDTLLGYVSEYYIVAMYYGSYTHLKIVISLLKDIYYNFYEIYDYEEFGFESLRYSILSYDFKNLKHICNRHSKIISTCSMSKVENLYTLSDKVYIESDREKLKLNIFKYLGYYFSDKFYLEKEYEILYIVTKWIHNKNKTVDVGLLILELIDDNIYRINADKVLDIIYLILKEKYYRFFDEVFKIISIISYKDISEEKLNQMKDIVIQTIIDVNECKKVPLNYRYIEDAIFKLRTVYKRKSTHLVDLDKIIERYYDDFYNNYIIDDPSKKDDIYKKILYYTDQIRSRSLQQKPGQYIGYSYTPQVVVNQIIKEYDIELNRENLIYSIAEVCKECLLNENHKTIDKIYTLHLLMNIKYNSIKNNILFDWIEYDKIFESDAVTQSYSDNLLDKGSKLNLITNILLYKCMDGNIKNVDLVDVLGYYENDTHEIIQALIVIKEFMSYSDIYYIDENVYMILIQFISRYVNNEYYEVRCKVIDCLFELINKIDKHVVINYIHRMSDDKDYRVKLFILKNIEKDNDKLIYRDILVKYDVDNHYLVRNKSKTILLES